ncbi:MAG TPA: sigma 54-interacting transcriptional regulator [Longimicrobiales bacterium]
MIVSIPLSESFAQLLADQAAQRGLDLATCSPGGVAEIGAAAAVIVAAAGVEEEATSLIQQVRAVADAPVVVVGAATEHPIVIALMRAGAWDYFALPGDVDRLAAWFDDLSRRNSARADAATLAEQQRASYDFSRMIGESPELQAALQRAARIIPRADATVLITGETGTGKELLAQAIHYNSPRAARPIVEVNCTALPANLLEAELFGYEKGAFTGATSAKPGLFEAAHGGTLFLDEIGDLTIDLQAKLLRALESRQVRRLGSLRTIDVDVRIIAATHVDLNDAVRTGDFREDLFYRLSVVPIHLPALRARGQDIILLAHAFVQHFCELYKLPAPVLDEQLRAALLAYEWPGNIRELKNAIERALLLGDGHLALEELVPARRAAAATTSSPIPFPARMEDIEKEAAAAMVRHCQGNKTAAASALGISRARLYRLLGEDEE